jgi:hypothetical protein
MAASACHYEQTNVNLIRDFAASGSNRSDDPTRCQVPSVFFHAAGRAWRHAVTRRRDSGGTTPIGASVTASAQSLARKAARAGRKDRAARIAEDSLTSVQ